MLFWTAIIILLAASIVAGAWLIKTQGGGVLPASLFTPRAEPRLAVTEYASVDSRRRIMLVRRDDVEHLIMTGGPVDVVIETGIGAPVADPASAAVSLPVRRARSEPALEAVAVQSASDNATVDDRSSSFGRRARPLNQVVNE